MKFPKSVHADGWAAHFDPVARPPAGAAEPRRVSGCHTGPKPVRAHTRRQGEPDGVSVQRSAACRPCAPVAAEAVRRTVEPAQTPTSSGAPWVVGAGIGVALIASVVLMARSVSLTEGAAPEAARQPPVQVLPLPTEPTRAGLAPPLVEEVPAIAEAQPAPRAAPAEGPVAPASPPARGLSPTDGLAQVLALLPVVPMPEPAPAPESPVALPQAAAMPASPPLMAPVPAVDAVDAGITVEVRQALASDATLAALPIVVSTAQGVVRLEGQAPDAQARERATVVASAATGVKRMDNRLTLPPTA